MFLSYGNISPIFSRIFSPIPPIFKMSSFYNFFKFVVGPLMNELNLIFVLLMQRHFKLMNSPKSFKQSSLTFSFWPIHISIWYLHSSILEFTLKTLVIVWWYCCLSLYSLFQTWIQLLINLIIHIEKFLKPLFTMSTPTIGWVRVQLSMIKFDSVWGS